MPCLVALLALMMPRVVIVLLVIFSDWIGQAYNNQVLLPFLGFLFMPYTMLAYALAQHQGGVAGIYLVLLIIAVIFDLGSLTGGGTTYKTVYVKKNRA